MLTASCMQCVAVCCSVLQCVAVCCSVLQYPSRRQRGPGGTYLCACCRVLQCSAVCYSVLQCVVVCCSVLQCVAVRCSVLPCVAVCCSVLLHSLYQITAELNLQNVYQVAHIKLRHCNTLQHAASRCNKCIVVCCDVRNTILVWSGHF